MDGQDLILLIPAVAFLVIIASVIIDMIGIINQLPHW